MTFTRKRQVRGRKLYNRLKRDAKLFELAIELNAKPEVIARVYGRRVRGESK